MADTMLYAAIGAAGGILSGFLGIGGGLMVVPALIYLCGFNQLTAQGTSLAVLLPPVGLLAFLQYYRNGHVNTSAGITICLTLFLGAWLGARLAQNTSPTLLRQSFAVFMILAAIKMLAEK